MNKFGILKTKILQQLTESYANGDKSKMREILIESIRNTDFKELYLFYEEIENKYIQDKENAKLYVEETIPILKEKMKNVSKFCKSLDKKLGNVEITENKIYSFLDLISEKDTLKNVDSKVNAKLNLIEHLTTKKEENKEIIENYTINENLLNTVLSHNFNLLYEESLNEEQKSEFKKILSISNEELETNFKILKEETSQKLNQMLSKEKDEEIKIKINQALNETQFLKPSKFNYYKLEQLKNGL